jgi:hypothetical protein
VYTTHGTRQFAYGVLVCIFLSNGALQPGMDPLWAYPAEILPFEISARGVTYMTGVMHIFGFFSVFFNLISLENIGWKYYIAFVVYTFLEVSLPQPRGPKLIADVRLQLVLLRRDQRLQSGGDCVHL